MTGMARLFGTDGVRGLANESLTAELALDLAVSAAHVLADRGDLGPPIGQGGHRPFAVVGRDPRISGQFLEAAVVAGLASAGVDVVLLGVLPTPGVAYLTDKLGADLGVMISASHNAMPDNGIKFLARGGRKLDDAVEVAIERQLHETWTRPTGGAVGTVRPHPTAVEEYAAHLVRSIDHPLVGLKVVIDCAEGAASAVGPQALTDAGAEVVAIHASSRRHQHQRRLRLDPPRAAAPGRPRARRRRRLRARRRRRPLPGRGRRRRGRRRRPDPGRSSRSP